ncbi:phage tail fiber protein [Orbus mooreae]|uniref:phage tail fiber protein n=1 Tax=Orbus mooreae TaxID=3074107 RepID=UPI00370DD3A8
MADIRSAPNFASATPLSEAVLSQNYRWGIFNGSDKAELGTTANMTLVSWNGVGFAPLYSSGTKNTNNTVVINTRSGTINALGGVYENNMKLPNKNETYIKKNVGNILNVIKYILLAEGRIAGSNPGNITLLVSGSGDYGGSIQQTDIVSFSTRNGGNLKITNLVQSDRSNTKYGIEKTVDNKFKLWMKTGPYTASVGIAKISGESSNSIIDIVNEPLLQDSEPDNITYATSEVTLKQGDGGFGSISLPSLNDFKSLTNNTGFYQAWGAKTTSPTTNCPPDSTNSTLTVTARSNGKVAHYEVIENQVKSPKKWIGQYYIGSEMKWSEVITTGNSTIDVNGFYKKASPIVRLVNPTSQTAIDTCIEDNLQKVGDGFANDQASSAQVKYLAVGHYEVHGSLGFAKSGWYIETPQDANGNKKLFVEYTTDQNNVITVRTYQNCFENGRFVAGEPMDIPDGRWIDLRLSMPEISTD